MRFLIFRTVDLVERTAAVSPPVALGPILPINTIARAYRIDFDDSGFLKLLDFSEVEEFKHIGELSSRSTENFPTLVSLRSVDVLRQFVTSP
jgi:hypothetical protein